MNTYETLEHLHFLLQECMSHPSQESLLEALGIVEDLREPYMDDAEVTQ